jgi:Phage virion morphogenesis family
MAGGDDRFLNITFEVAGQHEVSGRLATWGRNLTDLSVAWEQIGEDLLQDNRDNFLAEGGVFPGGFWPALALSTVGERIRLGYGGWSPMLVRTGALMESVTVRGGSNNVFRVGPMGVEVGTTDPKAVFHQYGTKRMPMRRVVGITNQRGGFGGAPGSILYRLNTEVRRQIVLAGLTPD